jgi:hypothetical protein
LGFLSTIIETTQCSNYKNRIHQIHQFLHPDTQTFYQVKVFSDQGFWPQEGLEVESPMASKRLLYEIALQGIEEN